ncbi:DNA mismatch repair protein Mlh3 [Armadillidium nasatum]|uniref:DNA mismatch repair protein Mlh3 n=1 Tax=Armadillidium nasatum TaxID=96803 RepID=A0A5N5SYF6_9CRUS|nr:DNA mismatch repair protein Mlh3 [Armadillidium nasatum]
MAPRIQRLSSPVKSKLRSGVNISSVSQCVEELVLNAVDSGATNIAVRVDLSIFRIQVVDNGVGISEQDMKLIGTRYTTSKCHSLEDLKYKINQYGFRGEALASIVEMSGIVDISSRYKNSSKTLEKLFTYGIAKSPTLCKYNKPSCGTTITIQDFMYNMPVRRKSIKESIDIEVMKSNIERIMLVSPNIAVTFKNERVGCNILEIRKCKSLLETFLQLFGSEHENNMSEVCHSLDQFKITGYISTQPHQTKRFQFVYINKRSVLQTKIHVLLNDLLSRSSIIRSKVLPNSTFPGPGKVPSSPPKGLKFYGIFVLNITCPRNEYDICLNPKKTLVEFRDWEKLLTCVEELILKFIKEENLTISLDDRFRKSEKEDSVSDFETPIPHSSQTILQAFSNTKQRGDREEFSKPPSKRIGFSDCIPAVYSLPARRHANVNIVKSTDSQPNENLNKCNSDLVETHKDCPQVQVSKNFNNSPKYQLNCERKSPAKNLSSLQALKHADKNVEHHYKPIHVTITDPDGADKKKPCYSSLQELKLANKKDVNDHYITPTNKIVPSVYPNVVNRSIDETLDIYNDKQDSCVQKPQLKLVRNSMHDECNTVSRALGKQYKEVVKKKNILNSLKSFHFNKIDRPIKNKIEEKTVELQNGVKIHTTSDDGFVNTKIITKSKSGENKFFHFDTTEDILDEINVEDLLNDRNSFFNSEGGVKKSCNRIEIESNFGSHQKRSSFIDKTKEIPIHCDNKLVTGEEISE